MSILFFIFNGGKGKKRSLKSITDE